MHTVLRFVLVNLPPSACDRRPCYTRLSFRLQTGSLQRDTLARKRQWRRYANL